ncbi:MAG: murein biosynthesis integral membrane protein MurJ [Eubacteriaceae bacterium]
MKRTAFVIVVITLLSKILGLVRDVTLAYYYGASNVSDAYLISLTIPGIIFTFIGVGLSTSFIPIYSNILNDGDQKSAHRFMSNTINFLLLICTIIAFICILFAKPSVKLFASGFKGETLEMAVGFTRISIFGIYFSGLINIYSSYLNVNNKFVVPTIMGIPFNLTIMLSIVLSINVNTMMLSIGNVLAVAFQFLFLLLFVRKEGYRYKILLDKNDKYLRKMIRLSLPVILGVSVNQINTLVDRTIASNIVLGGISALNYADKLNLFINGVFVMPIAIVMYPMISKMAAEKNFEGLKKSIFEVINVISLLVIPITIGAIIFSKQFICILFGRGAFDNTAIKITADALFFYSIGMIGVGFREVLSRVFYSLQDTKTPMVNAGISMLLNIVLNIILSKYLGIGGLAFATSLSAIFCSFLLFISLRKKIGAFGIKNISITFLKICCASLIMGFLTKLSYNALLNIINTNFSLLISIGIGVLTYFVIIYFMRIEDVDIIAYTIISKFRKIASNINQ